MCPTTRPGGQAVKTPPFHGGNTGSIPVRVTKERSTPIGVLLSFYDPTGSEPLGSSVKKTVLWTVFSERSCGSSSEWFCTAKPRRFPSGSPPKGARIPVRVTAERRPDSRPGERRPDSRPGHRRKAPGFPSGSPPKGARIPVRVTYIPVRVRQKLICYNRNNIPIESKERVP